MSSEDKVALITGGALRAGREFTYMLAREGYNVVVNYRTSQEEARETVFECGLLGVEAMGMRCDITDECQVWAMVEEIETQFGRIDVVVNSASVFAPMTFPTYDSHQVWKATTDVSINGTFYVCDALVPMMRDTGGGVFIQVVDGSYRKPWSSFMAHSVGKAAMVALTRSLALELAAVIWSNAVCLGPMLAPDGFRDEQVEALADKTLMRHWGDVKDATDAVKYLVNAKYVTGEVLTVDGGEQYG